MSPPRNLPAFRSSILPMMMKPAEVVVSEALDEIGITLKEKGIRLEELLERVERSQA